jgi:hypothetical protein
VKIKFREIYAVTILFTLLFRVCAFFCKSSVFCILELLLRYGSRVLCAPLCMMRIGFELG